MIATKLTTRVRALLSVMLLLVAAASIYFAPAAVTRSITITATSPRGAQRTETTEYTDRLPRFLDWLAVGSFVLVGWLWRRELGISQLGPLFGPVPPIEQTPAGSPRKSSEDSELPSRPELVALAAGETDTELRM